MSKILLAVVLAAATGCTGIQAVGPFAKPGSSGRGDPKADKNMDPPDPVVVPAPTPTPPKCEVQPEDVTAGNTELIMQKFRAELDADRRSMPSVPVTVEVSQVK